MNAFIKIKQEEKKKYFVFAKNLNKPLSTFKSNTTKFYLFVIVNFPHFFLFFFFINILIKEEPKTEIIKFQQQNNCS